MIARESDVALRTLSGPIKALSESWAASPLRPQPSSEALDAWDRLIEDWIGSELPFIFRTMKYGRGGREAHGSGRALTYSDNTPAHWAFASALAGTVPTIGQVSEMFAAGTMPLAFALKAQEKVALIYTRGGLARAFRLNDRGWKVCHIERVNDGTRVHPCERSLDQLASHLRRFLSPRNMFLIPITIGGLGETPEMVDAMRRQQLASSV